MKVLTFLEWYLNNTNNLCYTDLGKIEIISQFYSQPFKPEMITEYFENGAYTIGTLSLEQVVNLNLETLDDFISEIKRNSPFELIWKPEIVKEYFE